MTSNLEASKQTKEPYEKEFSVRVPKNSHKKHSVMRFKEDSRVKFREWKNIKLERENNFSDLTSAEQEMPKFGAGSEFGREAREEARKKKFGIINKKYKSENQPWILKVNGKTGKKFKGVQQGGFGENVAYYIFIQTVDASIEAYPLDKWYNFQPIQRYKTLSVEEAEEVMNQKSKVIDYSNIMIKKRLRSQDDDEEEDLLENKKKKKQSDKIKDFKISEMEDWIDSDDDSDSDNEEDKNKSDNCSKGKKKNVTKKKKKNSLDNEAFEESDDGDEEGRELDYISDSSASESELELQKEMKSVAEEDALKKLLASDEDEDEEDESDGKNNETDENRKNKEDQNQKEPNVKKESPDSLSNIKLKQNLNKTDYDKKPLSAQNVNSVTFTAAPSTSFSSSKQKRNDSEDSFQDKKRIKLEDKSKLSSSGLSDLKVITKDAVTRYLMRKPMTVIELLQKFRPQIKASLSKDEIALKVTKILRDINPTTHNLNGKLYFSIEN